MCDLMIQFVSLAEHVPFDGLFRFGKRADNADGFLPWHHGDLVGNLSTELVHAEAERPERSNRIHFRGRAAPANLLP